LRCRVSRVVYDTAARALAHFLAPRTPASLTRRVVVVVGGGGGGGDEINGRTSRTTDWPVCVRVTTICGNNAA